MVGLADRGQLRPWIHIWQIYQRVLVDLFFSVVRIDILLATLFKILFSNWLIFLRVMQTFVFSEHKTGYNLPVKLLYLPPFQGILFVLHFQCQSCIFDCSIFSDCDRQTNGQTDKRTDRRTDVPIRLRRSLKSEKRDSWSASIDFHCSFMRKQSSLHTHTHTHTHSHLLQLIV